MGKDPTNQHTTWWDPISHRPWALWGLIVAVLAIRVVWQLVSPYTLIEDEAHYWEWSRQLGWSYYSKGPGVAWLIRIATTVFGHTEFAVRLPAAICGALIAIVCARTTLVMFENRRLAFISAILAMGIPGFAIASMLMTIDAPYIACWAFASHFALVALFKDAPRAWVGFGVCFALGFVFKYTVILLLPGVLVVWWMTRSTRSSKHVGWVLLSVCIASLGVIPVAIWNAQHDWATVRHLLGHLGLTVGDVPIPSGSTAPWSIVWVLEYIGLQLIVGGPMIALSALAWVKSRQADESLKRIIRACIVMALPLLVFYLLVSLKAQTEGNWPMAAFVTLVPPGAWVVAIGIEQRSLLIKTLWGIAVVVLVGAMIIFPAGPMLTNMRGVGPLVPLDRMTGMREHAADAQRILEELRTKTGDEPFVISNHYGRTSLLAFYLPQHPVVYCSSALVGGRKTQYDMWTHTDLKYPATLEILRDRPALLLGGPPTHWQTAFERIEQIEPLDAEPKDHGTAYIGIGFRGFDPLD